MQPFVHLFFMDGVGLSAPDEATNPFSQAEMPVLTELLGEGWAFGLTEPIATERATLVPTDATMDVAGRPQSATGQATILTGRNVPQLIGEHYGPKPNPAVAEIIRQGTLFHEVVQSGGRAALLSPYPQGYFDAIDSGRRLYSAVPLAATSAGIRLRTVDDLRAGEAISPGFTNQGWRDHLGYDDIPVLSLSEAGQRLATLAASFDFSFMEHWPSDQTGHRGTFAEAVNHLEMIDAFLGVCLPAGTTMTDCLSSPVITAIWRPRITVSIPAILSRRSWWGETMRHWRPIFMT
ncbi:MAG: metalloenzyme domain-containing protein [Chloroflexota bacterium]